MFRRMMRAPLATPPRSQKKRRAAITSTFRNDRLAG
jgi:hypothetical protein